MKSVRATPLDSESYAATMAIFSPLGTRACGIYRRDHKRRRLDLLGTGIPVCDARYAAILTASHVIDALDNGDDIVIAGGRSLLRIPRLAVTLSWRDHSSVLDADVAAVALPTAAVSEMSAFYRFTHPNEIGDFEEYDRHVLYGFVGCPSKRNRQRLESDSERRLTSFAYIVREFSDLGASDAGKNDFLHVAFKVPLSQSTGPSGQLVTAPSPHGISGCGVWKIRLDSVTGQPSPPMLAGIGIEYHSRVGTFIATRAGAAMIALGKLWSRIDHGQSGIERFHIVREANPPLQPTGSAGG